METSRIVVMIVNDKVTSEKEGFNLFVLKMVCLHLSKIQKSESNRRFKNKMQSKKRNKKDVLRPRKRKNKYTWEER
jgi:hypothetical protein